MLLSDSKINEIRNLNLIYVFSTNSIFDKENNKYVGMKIVYNESSILEVDYKDPLFADLVRRVLDRYNKEKNKRNIILLGDFTKKLIKESSFYILGEKEEKEEQIRYYSYENKLLNKFKPYLFETIKLIVKKIIMDDSFKIVSLDGYNKRFNLNYTTCGVSQTANILIYNKNNVLNFKIGSLENAKNGVKGTIEESGNKVVCKFDFGEYLGSIVYDPESLDIIRKIDQGDCNYYLNDSLETVLEEDDKKIDYFLHNMGIPDGGNKIKVNDKTFLYYYTDTQEKDGDILYKDKIVYINLDEDIVRIIESSKEGFSKYDGIISVLLDSSEYSTTVRKYESLGNLILVVEKDDNLDYSYSIINLGEDKNLEMDCNIDGATKVELSSIEDIKQYKKGQMK